MSMAATLEGLSYLSLLKRKLHIDMSIIGALVLFMFRQSCWWNVMGVTFDVPRRPNLQGQKKAQVLILLKELQETKKC